MPAEKNEFIIFHGLSTAHHQKNMILKKFLNYEYGISQYIYQGNHLPNLIFIDNEVIWAEKTSIF